jgi:pimeloyl-ACP methyl ester carboxylesterase
VKLLLALLALLTVACSSLPRGGRLTPCTVEEVGAARCGSVSVPESWSRPGRTIDLNVVVLPATGRAREDAIFILQGGPGQAATTLADFYATTYAAARRERDIVLVDQRGTGKSHSLQCDQDETPVDLFPVEVVRRCRERHAPGSDLTLYTTAEAVRDAEAVREALGYERWNLYGTSYGTRVAMEYARRFPSRVRTMTLKGVVPASVAAPQGFARDTERAIELLLQDCAADAACARAYPDLRRDYAAVRERLAQGPVGELTSGRVAAVFRTLLQSTGGAARLPRLVHAAAGGDWAPLDEVVRAIRKQAAAAVSLGMFLSVVCSEDLPLVRGEEPRDTFLGNYWLEQVRGACAEWPRAEVEERAAVTLDVPTLLISGFLDPATPPAFAEEAQRLLPRSRSVVVRNGSHSFSGMAGCVDALMSAFVETADPAGLDDSCVGAIRRPPFE